MTDGNQLVVARARQEEGPRWGWWTLGHSIGMTVTVVIAWQVAEPRLVAAVGVASLLVLIVAARGHWTRRGFGKANAITFARVAAVVAIVAVPLVGPPATLAVLGVLALDGLDGWIARRCGEASAFGAKFDMETDALLVAVISVDLVTLGHLGAWALLPGLLRYVYAMAIGLVKTHGEAPRSRFGRYVFAILVASFAASLWPLEPAHRFLSAAASVLTAHSFARSLYWSFRPARAKVRAASSA